MRFHTKYRPQSLGRILGHEDVVSKLQKMVAEKTLPSAILLSGTTAAGKTTLARAFAHDVLGADGVNSSYEEVNLADTRSIEEVRGLIRLSNLRPMTGGHRIIMCDEAQGILGNPAAAQALLKPLEEPVASTTWILATMEIDKFRSSVVGRAILGRCLKLSLKPPETADKLKFAKRIVKGEKLTISADELTSLAENAVSFRDVAMTLEAVAKGGDVNGALQSSGAETEESKLVANFLVSVLLGDYLKGIRFLSQVKDGVDALRLVGHMSWGLLILEAHKGKRPNAMWMPSATHSIWAQLNDHIADGQRAKVLADLNATVTELRVTAGAFAVSEIQALAAAFQRFHSRHFKG